MTQTVNLEEIKCKLTERLTPSGWATKLRGFIQSSDFDTDVTRVNIFATRSFTPRSRHHAKAEAPLPLA